MRAPAAAIDIAVLDTDSDDDDGAAAAAAAAVSTPPTEGAVHLPDHYDPALIAAYFAANRRQARAAPSPIARGHRSLTYLLLTRMYDQPVSSCRMALRCVPCASS
jgi:hypothetical protein